MPDSPPFIQGAGQESAGLADDKRCWLGIEIGGTKLQLGVGRAGQQPLLAIERRRIDPAAGARGILEQIAEAAPTLISQHDVAGIGIGFGGPFDPATQRTVISHQIDGWQQFPLVQWSVERLGRPTWVDNDCNVACLAEATIGAGRGARCVFYVTVGTGVGGGLVLDGQLVGSQRPAVAEIGHLRPGLAAATAEQTVESIASGQGIERAARTYLFPTPPGATPDPAWMENAPASLDPAALEDLRARCQNRPQQLTAERICQAWAEGNSLAEQIIDRATAVLGWAIAQVVTLVAPEVVVVGGGVSLAGEPFFAKLQPYVQRYVFPPLADSVRIQPAACGESVVVDGAILLAQQRTG